MILIVDNYDSFTYNLVQQIGSLGHDVIVKPNDKISINDIVRLKPSAIIISPGPGSPHDAGISSEVIRAFYTTVPILGVCLGHQCIGVAFGAQLIHAKNIMHGKTSSIHHRDDVLFRNLPQDFTVARYHSLALTNVTLPLVVTATSDDGEIMALRHQEYPVFGIQFHPESFLSEYGTKIMENFLSCMQR